MVLGYITTAHSFVNLSQIEHSRYVQQNELMLGRTGDINPAVHRGKYGNAFVGGLFNKELFGNPNHVTHVDALPAHISTRFGNILAPLRRVFESSYDDEHNVRRPADLEMKPLNASHILFICHVLLQNDYCEDYTTLRRRMSAIIGPPRTWKSNTIMTLIAAMYCLLPDRGHSVVQHERLRRRWTAERNRK